MVKQILYVVRKTTSVTIGVNSDLKNIKRKHSRQYEMQNNLILDKIFTAYKINIKNTRKTANEAVNQDKNRCEVPSRFLHNGLGLHTNHL